MKRDQHLNLGHEIINKSNKMTIDLHTRGTITKNGDLCVITHQHKNIVTRHVITLKVHAISTHMRGCSTIGNYMIEIEYSVGFLCRTHVDFHIMTTISSDTNTFTNGTISDYTIQRTKNTIDNSLIVT